MSMRLAVGALAAVIATLAPAGMAAQPDGVKGNAYLTATMMLGSETSSADSEGYASFRFDLPFEASDARMSGLLSIHENRVSRVNPEGGPGAGGDIAKRTYRLVNDAGTWTGTGISVRANAADGRPAPMTIDTALLEGEGAYEGLIAYLHIELDWDVDVFHPEIRGLILAADAPPLPEPVPAE